MTPFAATAATGGATTASGTTLQPLVTTGFHAINNYTTVEHDWDFTLGSMPSGWSAATNNSPAFSWGFNSATPATILQNNQGTISAAGTNTLQFDGSGCTTALIHNTATSNQYWAGSLFSSGWAVVPSRRIRWLARMPTPWSGTNWPGLWSSLWVGALPGSSGSYQEIDMQEFGQAQNQNFSTWHIWPANNQGQIGPNYPVTVGDTWTSFHWWDLVWEAAAPGSPTGPQITVGFDNVAIAQASGLSATWASVISGSTLTLITDLVANSGIWGPAMTSTYASHLPALLTLAHVTVYH